jgi:histidinol-phosphate aminotransferase
MALSRPPPPSAAHAAGPQPVEGVRQIRAFTPPARPEHIDLFLDSNEGPPPPSRDDMLRWLEGFEPALLRAYPDPSSLQRLWARHFHIEPERVLITAGGDEAIDRACRAFLGPGREIILPVPTFEMLGHYPRLVGAETLQLPWPPGEPYPLDAVLSRLSPRTAVIAVVSPNNPTGAIATAADLSRLSAAAPDALLLIDQAYTEFADVDLTPEALDLPNAIIIRTLSKAWGLAGLRIGCALGPPDILSRLRAAGGPFTTPSPSLALAAAALEHRAQSDSSARYIDRVRSERAVLAALINELGGEAWPSQGNFVLARFSDAGHICAALAADGIAVRPMAPRWQAWDLEGCIRITCPGDAIAFERLTGSLRRALT